MPKFSSPFVLLCVLCLLIKLTYSLRWKLLILFVKSVIFVEFISGGTLRKLLKNKVIVIIFDQLLSKVVENQSEC